MRQTGRLRRRQAARKIIGHENAMQRIVCDTHQATDLL